MLSNVVDSKVTIRAERLDRRRLVNEFVNGLLIVVLTVTCVFSTVVTMTLMVRACWSIFLATSAISRLMLSVVPERVLSRIMSFWSARS